MTHRPVFVGVSLKMYLDFRETMQWCERVERLATGSAAIQSGDVELVVLPTFPALVPAASVLSPALVAVGAQDLFWRDEGAFTGEVSGRTLTQAGARYVSVGHAERRRMFGDTDDIVRLKVGAALRNGLTPILCVGESEPGDDARSAGRFCVAQLESALADLLEGRPADGADSTPIVVAYEPVWAIGATAPASLQHIVGVCSQLRSWLDGHQELEGSRIIYGGSAGAGVLGGAEGGLDGLFLGRSAHDPSNLGRVLLEAAELSTAGSR